METHGSSTWYNRQLKHSNQHRLGERHQPWRHTRARQWLQTHQPPSIIYIIIQYRTWMVSVDPFFPGIGRPLSSLHASIISSGSVIQTSSLPSASAFLAASNPASNSRFQNSRDSRESRSVQFFRTRSSMYCDAMPAST